MPPLPPEEQALHPSWRGRLRAWWVRVVTFGVPLLTFLACFFFASLALHAPPSRLGLWLALLGAGLAMGHLARQAWRTRRRMRLMRSRARA